jgi:hypothetical protein
MTIKTIEIIEINQKATTKRSDLGGEIFDIALLLSHQPPDLWVCMFNDLWRRELHSMSRCAQASAEGITITCPLGELESIHLAKLKKAVSETNTLYSAQLSKDNPKSAISDSEKAVVQAINDRIFKRKN